MTNGNDPINEVKSVDGRTMCGNDETRKWVKDTNAFLGLTKREYFAAIAMQGMYSNHLLVDQFNCGNTMAEQAIRAADALITELNKTP